MAANRDGAAVTLQTIASALRTHQGVELIGEAEVVDVHMDSRAVKPGSLYVAIRGARADGHAFIRSAIEGGAAGIAVEERQHLETPTLLVEDSRQALGWMAASVHHEPSSQLAVVGITGTNGKTTVAHMMAAMSEGTARQTSVVGTVNANLDGVETSPRTTPEADELQRIFRHLVEAGRITDVAVEVSSHAMSMGRINGTTFDLVAFTNLSQDHLDYHHTMEDYFAAKASLFHRRWAPRGVVWVDDPWGKRLASESPIPVVTVGTGDNVDVTVNYVQDTPQGSTFEIVMGEQTSTVNTNLAGRFNVANAAIALTCAQLQGWDIEHAIAALATMTPIRGRYNTLETGRDLWVVVDYAHTPDAIATVIKESRTLVPGRIIAVAGAGGDRDTEKRPLMGAALASADIAIVTTDNPRSEDPQRIIEQVITGVPAGARLTVEADRRLAIRQALSEATDGDVVLLLGKGHEPTQEFADRTIEFDDLVVAGEELARLAGGTS